MYVDDSNHNMDLTRRYPKHLRPTLEGVLKGYSLVPLSLRTITESEENVNISIRFK